MVPRGRHLFLTYFQLFTKTAELKGAQCTADDLLPAGTVVEIQIHSLCLNTQSLGRARQKTERSCFSVSWELEIVGGCFHYCLLCSDFFSFFFFAIAAEHLLDNVQESR